MVDQVCKGTCSRKKMLGKKFLKDPPVKVWAVGRKSHEMFEDPFLEFENYPIPIILMTASLGAIFSKSAN